jgi:hypothetical protein
MTVAQTYTIADERTAGSRRISAGYRTHGQRIGKDTGRLRPCVLSMRLAKTRHPDRSADFEGHAASTIELHLNAPAQTILCRETTDAANPQGIHSLGLPKDNDWILYALRG